ncbi:MAG: hypothetical protein BWY87_01409 [Deltaproteobacteria bacterium ADurb.Bin510]|nr:MAG: hypothetical protein BWY87_01409 [Deltaproteobacteria bacterium ADurb.Bin510]
MVAVAIDLHAGFEAGEAETAVDAALVGLGHLDALEFALVIEETQAVARIDAPELALGADQVEPVLAAARYRADELAGRLGRGRGDAVKPAIQAVGGGAALEALGRVGHEVKADLAERCLSVFWPAREQLVQALAVVGRYILNISLILEAALDLEGAHAGVGHLLEPGGALQVLEAQEVLLLPDERAACVLQIEGQTAGLAAFAAVGRTAAQLGAQVTAPAQAHAQGAMHEGFQLDCRAGLVDRCDLVEAQFARQHGTAEADVLEKLDVFGREVVHLGAGVQR